MPKVDFSNVSDEEFPLIPEGKYLCKNEKVTPTKTKDGQFDMWKLKHVITEGDFKGSVIFDNMTFNPNGLGRIKKLYSALGYDTSISKDCEPSDIEGGVFYVNIKHETYNGVARAKVEFTGYEKAINTVEVREPQGEVKETMSIEDELPF
jgi:hypothetical protein